MQESVMNITVHTAVSGCRKQDLHGDLLGEILLKLLFRKGFVVLICENFILHSDLEIKRMRI